MKRVKAIQSFHSNGYSMFFRKEVEVDDELAEDWKNAGLVEIVGEVPKVEEIKVLTPEEIERQNLEATLKQLGRVDGLDTLSNEELENNIHFELTKKMEARKKEIQKTNGQEDLDPTGENLNGIEENNENSAENENEQAENENEQAENENIETNTENQESGVKKGKKAQTTAE